VHSPPASAVMMTIGAMMADKPLLILSGDCRNLMEIDHVDVN
jgi:hypothetical protein